MPNRQKKRYKKWLLESIGNRVRFTVHLFRSLFDHFCRWKKRFENQRPGIPGRLGTLIIHVLDICRQLLHSTKRHLHEIHQGPARVARDRPSTADPPGASNNANVHANLWDTIVNENVELRHQLLRSKLAVLNAYAKLCIFTPCSGGIRCCRLQLEVWRFMCALIGQSTKYSTLIGSQLRYFNQVVSVLNYMS